jgi:hypothetical protein
MYCRQLCQTTHPSALSACPPVRPPKKNIKKSKKTKTLPCVQPPHHMMVSTTPRFAFQLAINNKNYRSAHPDFNCTPPWCSM